MLILSESFALFEVLFVSLVTLVGLVGCLMTLMFMLSSLSHFTTDQMSNVRQRLTTISEGQGQAKRTRDVKRA